MQFLEAEERDGIRFSWNVWPITRIEAGRLIVPISCMYTPLKNTTDVPKVDYEPVVCKGSSCPAVLNPYCQVDFINKIWICPFCLMRNHFPTHYVDISPDNLPAELIPDFTTLEYQMNATPTGPPVFVFCIDTCIIEEELQKIKNSILQSLTLLPADAYVGLVTFGKNVNVFELGFQECPKSFIFNGNPKVPLSSERVIDLLSAGTVPDSVSSRFLAPVSDCEFILTTILDDLCRDAWPIKNDERPSRCTGTALSAAIGLLDAACPAGSSSARLMLLAGGPPSAGAGRVVDGKLAERIRSHRDLFKGNAPLFDDAKKYYVDLAERCVASGHTVDIFACSLDQVGLAEMKVLIEKTGGTLMLSEMFTTEMFTDTFKKIFKCDQNNELEMTFDAELDVVPSREFKVCGAIGSLSSLKRGEKMVSDVEIGISQTTAWRMGTVTPASTVAVYFEVANTIASNLEGGRSAYLQFVTKFKHSRGTSHARVTTVAIPFADTTDSAGMDLVRSGFDQEAACVLVGRWAVYRAEMEFAIDVLRWTDRSLIKLISKFAGYRKGDTNSFQLSAEFSYYPQFMFYLRRSQFLQIFNSSPDETAFYRLQFMRETVANALTMIQPTLVAYSLDEPPAPVMLDTASRHPERILILDTFFQVVCWYGERIAAWRQQGLHDDPEYGHFADLLNEANAEVKRLVASRQPCPNEVQADSGTGSARFLTAKLNPSTSYNDPQGYGEGEPPPVFTDDVSLKVFMEHLRKLAVQTES
eukprot:180161_1